jgi:hypothetical protein
MRQSYSEDTHWGAFTAEFGSINGRDGAGTAEWIAFEPPSDLVPDHKSFIEILATIFSAVALLFGAAGILFFKLFY